jgi:hypothetical protein
MTINIYINLNADTTIPAAVPWSYNDIFPAVTTAVSIKSDLIDDSNASTGISLTALTGVSGSQKSTTVATDGAGGWPEEIFETNWFFGASGETHQLGGLTNGDSITIEVAGHTSNAARDTDFTVAGTTTRYDSAGTGVPNAPISFTDTISGTTHDIDMAIVSSFGYVNGYKIIITPATSGPTLTGPASTTEQAATVAAGTVLDDVTIFSLISGTFSIEQTIDSSTATTLNYVAESGVNDCTPSTPVSGVPLAATISAAGVTPYQIQQEADDGVNTPAVFNITLNGEATHETVQVMIGTSNTTPGESVLATTIIAVENNMQYHAPKVVDTVTITWAADGTFTTDKDQTIIVPVDFISPTTKQWSCIDLTIKDTSIISGGGIVSEIVSSIVSNIVSNVEG